MILNGAYFGGDGAWSPRMITCFGKVFFKFGKLVWLTSKVKTHEIVLTFLLFNIIQSIYFLVYIQSEFLFSPESNLIRYKFYDNSEFGMFQLLLLLKYSTWQFHMNSFYNCSKFSIVYPNFRPDLFWCGLNQGSKPSPLGLGPRRRRSCSAIPLWNYCFQRKC